MSGRQSTSGGRRGRSNAGRFNRNGRGGGHGFNRNTNYNNNRNFLNLKGACEELKDCVYTVGDARQADRYSKTTERIVNYIQTNYEQGQDVKDALVALEPLDLEAEKPKFNEDEDENDLSYIDEQILLQQIKDYVARIRKYNDNMNKAYGLILGQCTQGVKNKLEAQEDWAETIEKEHNPIKLLKAIKEITQDYQDSRYPIAPGHRSLITLLNIKQEEKEGLSAYMK